MMLTVEIFHSDNEKDLTDSINYFLSQLEEHLVKDIKFSSFATQKGEEVVIIYTALIMYLVR